MNISKGIYRKPINSASWCIIWLLSFIWGVGEALSAHSIGIYYPMNAPIHMSAPALDLSAWTFAAEGPKETSMLRRRRQGVGPVVTLASPCSCREWTAGSQGNATTPNNGQFVDTIVVWSGAGESWTLVGEQGMYDINSPQPPQLPWPLLLGTVLDEAQSGKYVLPVVHVDAMGYEAVLTNGADTLAIANTCYYPEPDIVAIDEAYCSSNVGTPLIADVGGAIGTGSFDILADDAATLLVPNAEFFSPNDLDVGTYFVRYTFDQSDSGPCMFCAPGCVQQVLEPVDVVDPPSNLICNDGVQLTLDTACTSIILPDMLLEGAYPNYSIYQVHAYWNGTDIGNVVGQNQVGHTLDVQVLDNCNDSYCWTTLTVEDKGPPVFDCPSDTVQLACTADLAQLSPPVAWDNCGVVTPVLSKEVLTSLGCGAAVRQRLVRTWVAVDSAGNTSVPCTQVFELRAPQLDEVVFPPHLNGIEAPALPCSTGPDTSPAQTGMPTLNGLPIVAENHCSLLVSWSDEVVAGCGMSYAILRTWTVMDWCAPANGQQILTYTQLISVQDNLAPQLNCPDSLLVNAAQPNCAATAILPPIDVSDACDSELSVQVQTPAGLLAQNGGVVPNVPLGVHTITWMAADACGNQATCTTILQVADQTAPVALCDELTTVSLDANGTASIFATSFDDASYDNCSEMTFAARRMDQPDAPFAELVTFSCSDMLEPVPVVVQVRDAAGNANQCMVSVSVQDKVAPTIVCPPDITIDCDEDASDLLLTGFAHVEDNCTAFAAIYFENLEEVNNNCGEGVIMRQFVVVDGAGLQSTCMQQITTHNKQPFTESDINWPAHYETYDCVSTASLHPDSLPAGFNRPTWQAPPCALIAFNYEDQVFEVAPPACFKIVRTWTVLDWCAYDPTANPPAGLWQYTQEIRVYDDQPPIVTCPKDTTVALGSDCTATFALATAEVIDCSPMIDLSANSVLGSGTGPFSDVPQGTYVVTWTAMDGCGNSSSCAQTVSVRDLTKPTPVCINGLIVELSDTAMQVLTPAADFNLYSSDNCTPTESLVFSFSENPADSLRKWDCDSLGARSVQIWVTDQAGNSDYCITYVEVQDNMSLCTQASVAQLSGRLMTPDGQALAGATVHLNGYMSRTAVTDAQGSFAFTGLPSGYDYSVWPEYQGAAVQGISTFDLVLLTRHILNLQPLDGPWSLIAADVNGSGSITTFDALKLRRLILGIDTDFGSVPTWRFIPADYAFADVMAPWEFPEVASINDLAGTQLIDFVAVKMGDLDGSWLAGNHLLANRSDGLQTAALRWEKVPSSNNDWVLRLPDTLDVWGVCMALHFPEGQASSWSSELIENGAWTWDAQGRLRIAMAFGESQRGKALLHLHDVPASRLPRLVPDAVHELVTLDVHDQWHTWSVALQQAAVWHGTQWVHAVPNPFEATTSLVLQLHEGQEVQLELTGLDGRMCYRAMRTLTAGTHVWQLPSDVFVQSGVYIARLRVGNQVQVLRLVRQ